MGGWRVVSVPFRHRDGRLLRLFLCTQAGSSNAILRGAPDGSTANAGTQHVHPFTEPGWHSFSQIAPVRHGTAPLETRGADLRCHHVLVRVSRRVLKPPATA